MISVDEIRRIAKARLEDSEVLYGAGRFDGAAYLCGYAIEAALKARICGTLKWAGFPSTNREFQDYRSFRTHSLDVLLSLAGVEREIRTRFLAEWSIVVRWDPEIRYRPVGTAVPAEVQVMKQSSKALLSVI